jgi:hypothetical protein
MQAIFTCPIPPMLNEQINLARSHWANSSKSKTQWTGECAKCAAGLPAFPGVVWLDFCWQVKRLTSDPDNVQAAAKYVLDGLVKAGILVDDSLKIVQSPVIHRFQRGESELFLTISDCPIYRLEPAIEVLAG